MGYRLAEAAIDQGAVVTLVSGPTLLKPPYGQIPRRGNGGRDARRRARVRRRRRADHGRRRRDYRPATARTSKIKKGDPDEPAAIELVRNPGYPASIDQPGLLKVGFAAETEDLIANAQDKLRRKGLGMIIANDAVKTIGSDRSIATIVLPHGEPQSLPLMDKADQPMPSSNGLRTCLQSAAHEGPDRIRG